ncbi:Membrane protein insertase YidC [Candidatus Entotheonellaceae bacterium PAL068K]
MEKRALLAIMLSLLVIVIWSIIFTPPSPTETPPIETSPAEQQAQETLEHTPRAMRSGVQTTRARGVTGLGTSHSVPQAVSVMVDTGVAQLMLTSRGGTLKTVRLLEYLTSLDEAASPIEIAPVLETTMLPLSATLTEGSRTRPLAQLVFEPSETTLVLSEGQPEGTIVFRGRIDDDVAVERAYHFRYGSYVFEVSTQIEGLQLPPGSALHLSWGPGLRQQREATSYHRGAGTLPRSYINGKVVDKAPKEVGETLEARGEVTWAALADTYFAAVLMPQESTASTVAVQRMAEEVLGISLGSPVAGSRAAQRVRVYVGPKKEQLLEETDATLDKLIDLGFFSPLARPMVHLMRLINGVVHNYGVTIILITFLIKLIFAPLTQKSYKSMQAMQKLQPKMKELQTIYKDDRPALQRATMQLYRDEKVNPMGSCLPMLLQIPFFFAFYNALLYSFELRHAPFICWRPDLFWIHRGICDLSAYDPSYITPLLMGASMFLQQRMTPTTGDPTQAKIMQFMPLIFLFFFLWAPAGLVLYWLVNNVLSIAQQLLVNRSGSQEAITAGAASKG